MEWFYPFHRFHKAIPSLVFLGKFQRSRGASVSRSGCPYTF
ncbi:uncharacterized protein METZ01_LOCUS156841, partial [marine metagenome]